jgi:hypothetical protein
MKHPALSPPRRAAWTRALLGAALFALASCSSSSNTAKSVQSVHEFEYDTRTGEYIVLGQRVSEDDVQRDLAGSLCSKCHADAVGELKASVHYQISGRTERVWFPGGGAHGMLDRACGLPATTGLTNYLSDVNLGECAKCHVGRYLPVMEGAFASMFQQMGVADPQGQATQLVDSGLDCLICHAEEYSSVPAGGSLAVIAPSAGVSGASPTAVGAARAARDNADFNRDGVPDLVIDMDGDGTFDAPLMVDSDGDGLPDTPWATVAQDRSLEALSSIGKTNEHTCLRCHEHARTGYKRGTLFADGHDVHASLSTGVFQGAENRCTTCHTADDHKFVRGHMVGGDLAAADYPPPPPGVPHDPADPTDLACTTCHDATALPASSHLESHMETIACETCHIPYGSGITYSLFGHGGQLSFARNAEGKDTKLVVADMYVAGDEDDLALDTEAYRTPPILMWFDGGTSFLAQSLSARGSPNAKIMPFKPMANGMIFDARYFDGVLTTNAVGAPYNAHSMYRFFANNTNAEAFYGLGMLDMTPDQVRQVTLADFQNPDRDFQAMALMQIFPNLVYFDKAAFGYEHYLTTTGSPHDGNGDGVVDLGQPFQYDMLGAANSGLRQFAGFNAPMGFPPNYSWYPGYDEVSDVISMKLPDGSLMKMFLQMQAQTLPVEEQQAWLDAIDDYPAFSQITLGGHGVAPKEEALSCLDCHAADTGVLSRTVPVGVKVPTSLGAMGVVELPVYQWKYYNLDQLVDLGLTVTSDDVASGAVDVDIDGDPQYLRASTSTFVINWFAPDAPGGYVPADDASALLGTSLTTLDLTWNGGAWMPVLEPVTELVPNWEVLGLYPNLIW